MSINFPNDLDNLSNPTSADPLSGHAQQHSNANDAIEALQIKVGIDGSNNTDSLDYRVSSLEAGGQTGTELGLAGNNDITVYGIENKTTLDTFSKSMYGTIRYVIQFIKGSEIVSNSIDIVNDQTDLYVQETEISSNTENPLATTILEENSGIISLSVTPISGSVSVRYYRTALKI